MRSQITGQLRMFLSTTLIAGFFLNLFYTGFDAYRYRYRYIWIHGLSYDMVPLGFHLNTFQISIYIVFLFAFNFIFLILPITLINLLLWKFTNIILLSRENIINKIFYVVSFGLVFVIGICLFFINDSINEISLKNPPEVKLKTVTGKENLPNIFYIVIDALRADHLGCYGYEKNTSPNIDKMADRGVVFNNCIVQAPWTIPSVPSYFTSLYPSMTGFTGLGDVLADPFVTLAEVLQENGWTTAGFSANPNISRYFNYHQGFDYFYDKFVTDTTLRFLLRNSIIGTKLLKFGFIDTSDYMFTNTVSNEEKRIEYVNKKVIDWLENQKKKSGLFLYIMYLDTHIPYSPPEKYVDKDSYPDNIKDKDIILYDGEIKYVDYHLAHLVRELRKLDILENSIFIITSDHGEEFIDDNHEGKEHGYSFYEELVRVPLIMLNTKLMPVNKRIDYQVRALDIYPTILDFLNIKITHKVEGQSFKKLLFSNDNKYTPPIAYMEGTKDVVRNIYGEAGKFISGIRVDNKYKLIKYRLQKTKQYKYILFNLEVDPKETKDISDQNEDVLEELKKELDRMDKYVKSKAIKLRAKKIDDQQIRKELKTLGYIQ